MATASMQPELKGTVIISLAYPPSPQTTQMNEKLCAAFFMVRGGGGSAQQQHIPIPNPRGRATQMREKLCVKLSWPEEEDEAQFSSSKYPIQIPVGPFSARGEGVFDGSGEGAFD